MRVMTLGQLARRQRHYGVGQLEQRPVGLFLTFAALATTVMVVWIVFDRLGLGEE